MTTNNLISMHKEYVVADLYFRSANFVVSIRPYNDIYAKENDM